MKSNNKKSNEGIAYIPKPHIRNYYKQKKLSIDNKTKKIKRYSEKDFEIKFNEISTKEKIKLSELLELLEHNNINVKYIEFFLDKIAKEYKNKFKEEIMLLYPFMPVKLCKKYNVNKEISEKERFYNLINKISKADEFSINKILDEEYGFPKELESLNYTKEEKENLNRWGLYGTKVIDFSKIENEEFFYYVFSNHILNNFKDNSYNIKDYLVTFKFLDQFSIETDNYLRKNPELFEYIVLFLLNCQKTLNTTRIIDISLYQVFAKSLMFELNKNDKLTDVEIKSIFKKEKIETKIENNNLCIKGGSIEGKINNYKNYNITKELISKIISQKNFLNIEDNILPYLNFDYLKNPKNYFDGLLYQIIEKYVSSKLCKTSIYKSFN